jgi:hypothetical protein
MLVSIALQILLQLRHVAATGFDAETQLQLAGSPAGRIVLHVACAWRDHRFQWHWRGMVREVVRT